MRVTRMKTYLSLVISYLMLGVTSKYTTSRSNPLLQTYAENISAKQLAEQLKKSVKNVIKSNPIVVVLDSFTARTNFLGHLCSDCVLLILTDKDIFSLHGNTQPTEKRNRSPYIFKAGAIVLLFSDTSPSILHSYLRNLRLSALWNSDTKVVIVLQWQPSQSIINSLADSLARHDVTAASCIQWDSTFAEYRNVHLPKRTLFSEQNAEYIGKPCMKTLIKPGNDFGLDIGDAALAEELGRRVAQLDPARCMDSDSEGIGQLLPNGTYSGHVGRMVYGRTVMLGHGFASVGQWGDLVAVVEFLYPYVQDDYCIDVTTAGAQPFLESASGVFSKEIYLCLLGVFVMCTLVQFGGLSHRNLLNAHSCLLTICFQVFRTLLTGTFQSNIRRFLVQWILLSVCNLIFSQIFIGCLSSLLAVPLYFPNIDTLEEANYRLKSIYLSASYINAFTTSDESDIVYQLQKKFKPVLKVSEYYTKRKEISEGESIGVASQMSYSSVYKVIFAKKGRPTIHVVKQCILRPSYKRFMVRKGLPYARKMNSVIQTIIESGVWYKFHHDSVSLYLTRKKVKPLPKKPLPQKPYPLNLDQMFPAFVWLVLVELLCAFVFVLELVTSLYMPSKSKMNKNKMKRFFNE